MTSSPFVRVFRDITLVAVLSLVAGCFRPSFEPEGAVVPQDSSRRLCAELNTQRNPVESVRVLADATISSMAERASFRYVVVSKEPSSFRVDVLPLNGAFTLGLLVSHDGKALWLNSQERTYSEDRDERRLVAEYLGLRGVSRETAVALMTGLLPKLSCSDITVYEVGNGDKILVDHRAHVAWRVRGASPEIVSARVLDPKGEVVEMEASVGATEGSAPRVLALEIFSPARARVDLSLTKVAINPPLSERLFEVKPPTNYTLVD